MRRPFSAVLAALTFLATIASAGPLKEVKQEARDLFERGDYPAAVRVLEQAAGRDSLDADFHYLLGYYTHYSCYDSRPAAGCDALSDRVLEHLKRAIALDPALGNARYFIGAERGGRARIAMGRGDWDRARAELHAAREEGALPDWLIEYGRNSLRSCGPDAILVAGGDAEVNPVQYLQLVEGYRTDVTLIPIAVLDVSWYALLLKRGGPGTGPPAPIEWTEEQVLGMRPFKWKANPVEIPIGPAEREAYGLAAEDTLARWTLESDLTAGATTYLSPSSALLVHIVETNRWRRPVHVTLGCPASRLAGLGAFLEVHGLTQRLLPVETEPRGRAMNARVTEALLLDPVSYRDLASVREHDMPRVSPMLQNYRAALMQLAAWHAGAGERERAREVLDAMDRLVPESALPMSPQIGPALEGLRKALGSP